MNLLKKILIGKGKLTSKQRQQVRKIYKEKNCVYCRFLIMANVNLCSVYKRTAVRYARISGVKECLYWKADKWQIRREIRRN